MNSCSGLLGLFHPAAAESGEQGDFICLTGIVEFQQGLSGGENIALGAQDFDIADRAVAIERSGALQGDIQRGEIALLGGNLIGQALAQGQRVGHLFKGGLDFCS